MSIEFSSTSLGQLFYTVFQSILHVFVLRFCRRSQGIRAAQQVVQAAGGVKRLATITK